MYFRISTWMFRRVVAPVFKIELKEICKKHERAFANVFIAMFLWFNVNVRGGKRFWWGFEDQTPGNQRVSTENQIFN